MKTKEENAEKKLIPLLVIFAFVILATMILISVQRMHLNSKTDNGSRIAYDPAFEEKENEEDYGLTPLSIFVPDPHRGYFSIDSIEYFSLIPDYRKTIQAVWVDQEMGNFAEAEKTLRKLLVSYPYAADIIGTLGNVCYHQGKFKDAEEFYVQQLRIFPDDPSILNNIAMTQLKQQKYADALFNMTKVVSLLPDSGEALLNLAVIYENMGKRENAVRYFLKAYDKLGQAIMEFARADIFNQLKQEPEVAKILEKYADKEKIQQSSNSGSKAEQK